MYQYRKQNKGFTLVELMLAMSFIAILLISIAMLSIYLTTLYDQGSTMKDINQAGTEIASDIKHSIAAAPDNFPKARKYIIGTVATQSYYVNVLCMGSVSYVFNRGDSLETLSSAQLIKYSDNKVIRLAKVDDGAGTLCTPIDGSAVGAGWPSGGRKIAGGVTAKELLSQESGHTLSVWGLSFSAYPVGLSPELSTLNLTIGTSESADIDFTGPYPVCNAGNGSEWCGINTFEIVGRSGNGSEL